MTKNTPNKLSDEEDNFTIRLCTYNTRNGQNVGDGGVTEVKFLLMSSRRLIWWRVYTCRILQIVQWFPPRHPFEKG